MFVKLTYYFVTKRVSLYISRNSGTLHLTSATENTHYHQYVLSRYECASVSNVLECKTVSNALGCETVSNVLEYETVSNVLGCVTVSNVLGC